MEDGAFPRFEVGGDEAFFVGQGLTADPVVRYGRRLGPTDGEEIAEGAVVLQTEIGVAAQLTFLLFLFSQPAVLIVELVAQAIEQGIDAVVDQAPLAQAQRRGVDQLVADRLSQGQQVWVRHQQMGEPIRSVG